MKLLFACCKGMAVKLSFPPLKTAAAHSTFILGSRIRLERSPETISTVLADEFDAVITNAAGCGSTLKEYDHLLHSDPAYRDQALQFKEKMKDITEFLAGIELNPAMAPSMPSPPIRTPVTWRTARRSAPRLENCSRRFRDLVFARCRWPTCAAEAPASTTSYKMRWPIRSCGAKWNSWRQPKPHSSLPRIPAACCSSLREHACMAPGSAWRT